jgi:sugar phosphate isomerase/epimerase
MKLGLSTYSLDPLIASGSMTLAGALDWAAAQNAAGVELVPFAYTFETPQGGMDRAAIAAVKTHARDAGVELMNYSVLADLCQPTLAQQAAEIARIKKHIDIAAELGVPRMRHDLSAFRRPRGENGVAFFERLFPQMADAAGALADYAAPLGVTTLLENHGFFANGCDRVERLLQAVNRPNYALLLDTGNIACVDEDPAVAARTLARYAQMIHLKDFYIRKRDPGDTTAFDCGGHWFQSNAGRYLRGAILAQGDLDIWEILGELKGAGYDGPIAIEFEGFEEPRYASKVSLDNARRIWDESSS